MDTIEQTLLGKVKDVKILKAKRDIRTRRLSGLNGLVIEFETEETITDKTVVQLIYNDEIKPFNVREIEVSGDKLLGRAVECGYWAHKLEKQENLDLRTLIDCDIRMVKDEETLKNIRQASLWT